MAVYAGIEIASVAVTGISQHLQMGNAYIHLATVNSSISRAAYGALASEKWCVEAYAHDSDAAEHQQSRGQYGV